MSDSGSRRKFGSKRRRAFTRIELLAIIATLACGIFLAAPIAASNRDRSQSAQCINNLRQLVYAWQLYADNSDGKLVENYHGAEAQGGAAAHDLRKSPWALGWLDFTTSRDNTNILFIQDSRYAKLAPFFLEPGNIHKCPSDVYLSASQKTRGWKARVRSVAMNATLGAGNVLTGPWDPVYRQSSLVSSLINPSPAETTVIFDEHPGSINDPMAWPPRSQWIDWPGNYHEGSTSFSFADGHVELHAWRASMRLHRVGPSASVPRALAGDADISWMSYHSQRATAKHY